MPNRELTSFPCAIIHEMFLLMDNRETVGSFHALVIVSLTPVKINNISLRVSLGIHSARPLSKTIAGVWEIGAFPPYVEHGTWALAASETQRR